MAITTTTVLEVQHGGSDTNGGGFDPTMAGGTDYSQTTSAHISVTDGVTNGTTTITSATAAFTSGVVGNLVYVSGGAGDKKVNGPDGDAFYDNIMLWAVKNGMTAVNMQRRGGSGGRGLG